MQIDGFDHAMLAVTGLDDAARKFRGLGFAVVPGGRHIGRGTENVLMRFGWTWLELITVRDPQERASLGLAVDGLSDVLREQRGGYVDVILETHDVADVAARYRDAGIKVHEFSTNRLRPDGLSTRNHGFALAAGSTRHLYPSFIEWQQADPERLSPERQAPHPNGAQQIVGMSLIVRDLTEATRAYSQVLGLPVDAPRDVPALGATCVRCMAGRLAIDLLAAKGRGVVQSGLDTIGEGLFELRIRVSDFDQSVARLAELGVATQGAAGVSRGMLLPQQDTFGARIVLAQDAAPMTSN